MSLTAAQQEAVVARGNVLVVAGAGTGKTRTLVERCLNCLLEESPPASLDEILMVTFTEAAAAEMRQRIRVRLEAELAAALKKDPHDSRWQEQIALFETAHIGTLHGFCLQLIRQHFYELELDPQLSVLAEEEARLLADETLAALLQKHYAGTNSMARSVQDLIKVQGRGMDRQIRMLVLRLHHYTQTLPNPLGWFEDQLAMFAAPEPALWRDWLLKELLPWTQRWLPLLERVAPENDLARNCLAALKKLKKNPARAEAAAALKEIASVSQECPQGKKSRWLKPLEQFFAETEFLFSLAQVTGSTDPLAEDWQWVRGQMTTLLQLAREFGAAFAEAKHELGAVDFHDLEQYALRLLWDPRANQPTKTALQWRKKLRFVFVDEYQDINAAQDKIIEALSRQGADANRFLVGDVKQSIYRFRLANPYIFQGYVDSWSKGAGRAIPLVENFRSREDILNFVNSLFTQVMRRDLGGVAYDENAKLRFGAAEGRAPLSAAANLEPRVELNLLLKRGAKVQDPEEEVSEELAQIIDMEQADKEARLVAMRLLDLKTRHHAVWDESTRAFRPVEWRDMAILLRSPSNKAESYAKEFSRLNVPLVVARGGFYDSLEISDLLSLLRILDNPLQDLPVLAVLRSPLVGLTLDELAGIRLQMKGPFSLALARWREHHQQAARRAKLRLAAADQLPAGDTDSGTFGKVAAFLDRFARWRRLARQVSLSRCLDTVLAETHYASWLVTQPRGEQRYANVQRLLSLAQQFDRFQRQGLFRFLRFIEAQQLAETEPDVPTLGHENSVTLMSIHQSKGLEFPVVAIADLGKAFNFADSRADVILDEVYGLCPQIKPPQTGRRYPSLPFWLARRRQHRELLGEELRLLYVAMTRARDTLLLTGSISAKQFNTVWRSAEPPDPEVVLAARSYAQWLGYWFSQQGGQFTESEVFHGENSLIKWAAHDESKLIQSVAAAPPGEAQDVFPPREDEVWFTLSQRLSWAYPFTAATHQPAKTSVSLLRRRAQSLVDDAAAPRFEARVRSSRPALKHPKVAATDIGRAHHTFLQLASLDRVDSVAAMESEAQRLLAEHALTEEEAAVLDFETLAAFWRSDVGQTILAQKSFIQRELAFTARFSLPELAAITGDSPMPLMEKEFVVVQGVADLVVLLPQEIWLLDFKTDTVGKEGVEAKAKIYSPQLKLYAQALARIYQRPVTKCWLYFLGSQETVVVPPG